MNEAKQEALTVCLAKAVEEIRRFVEPMGGWICPGIKMRAGGIHNEAVIKITISFQETALSQYISEAYPQEESTDRK